MKKILFLIHDLGQGGAEKVLVNLVNNMDPKKFDITVTSLFGGGVNEPFLAPHIHYHAVFSRNIPGNSHLMKLLTPKQLHKLCVKEHYDIEVAYLEGPSARVISGCCAKDTKLVCWIHSKQYPAELAAASFRSKQEAEACYNRFHSIACVSEDVRHLFTSALNLTVPTLICYNTNESNHILQKAAECPSSPVFSTNEYKLIGVGKLEDNKGFDRLIRITARLRRENYPVHTYILGIGTQREALEALIYAEDAAGCVDLLGYQTNPYQYVSKCDLFICSSHSEGFSTAATESLIVGTPVCTVEVSGMKEMLGSNNEYGLVTENSEDGLYAGIKQLLDHPELLAHYTRQAELRGKDFSTEHTVTAVETMLESL